MKVPRTLSWRLRDLHQQLVSALAEIDQIPPEQIQIPPTEAYLFPLLNLQVWSLRYHVSLKFILTQLLNYYRPRFVHLYHSYHSKPTLRVPNNALTGQCSRRIVEDAVMETFPGDENVAMELCEQRQRLYNLLPVAALPFKTLNESAERYQQLMRSRRVLNSQHGTAFKRRPWRNNPWR